MLGKLTKHMRKTHKIAALVGGGLALAAAFLVRLSVGSPLAAIRFLAADRLLPPLWLMGLLWLLGLFLLGVVGGLAIASTGCGGQREALLWRGCTCLLLTVVFSLIWYALLFGKFSLFFSWICLPLAAAVAVLCFLSWRRPLGWAALVPAGYALWSVILFLLQFAVMLHN